MQRRVSAFGGTLTVLVVGWILASLDPGTAFANPLTPASPQARLESDLFWITIGIAMVVLVAVEFLLIYTSLRFRKRPGVVQPEPAQIHGNTRLELMWSILPAIILVSLFIVSVRTMAQVGNVPSNARVIQVVGRQFAWDFTYPDANVRVTNDLRIPVGQPVVLEITAQDVIHSFWVPDLGGKIDANPGLTNRLSWTAERAGVYRGVCTELCGVGHANMLFTVTAMEPSEFESWLREGGQAAAAQAQQLAAGPSPELGRQLVVEKGCGACHAIAGVQGMNGAIGPPLTNIGTVGATRKPGTSAEDYIRESIQQPNAFTAPGFPPGLMPVVPMSDQELAAVVAYLASLK
jgi:cytochrome c oxidase subunit II